MKKLVSLSYIPFFLLLLTACAKNPVTGKSQVVLMSEAEELKMGRDADPQIITQYGLYNDSSLQRYMNEKGQQIVPVSHRPNIEYHFRILNSNVINAFAIPGYVYFTRGIMAYFNNEAEFEGVLGHEMGHIAARHTVSQQRNAMLGQLGLIAGILVAPVLADFADVASQGVQLMLLKNSRDDEREADKLGVEYSTKLGYDAQQMADFFKTLEREQAASGQQGLPPFLSTHPDPGERYTTVSKLAAEWKQKQNLTNPLVNRDSYLKRIEGLVFGDDPREGFLENGIFYHPGLRFQFEVPSGWAYENTPQRVQMAPKNGKALLMLMQAPGQTLVQAAEAVAQQYKLQVVDSKSVQVNGLPAIIMVASQSQQNGSVVKTISYFIQQGTDIYHLIGVAMQEDFNTYVPYFTRSMESFRNLTDPAKINVQPDRIRIKTVGQGGTLTQVLRSLNVPEKRLEEHAILNGLALTDNVPAGTLVKIIAK